MPVSVGAKELLLDELLDAELILLDELLDAELLLLEELLEADVIFELSLLNELLVLSLDAMELEIDVLLEPLSLQPAIKLITIAPRNNDLISLFMLFPFVEIDICINSICLIKTKQELIKAAIKNP